MEINLILNKLKLRIPKIEKLVDQIDFQFCNVENRVAFLQGTTIYYTAKLFTTFTEEEQLFIVAHEIMHYIKHCLSGKYQGDKGKDEDLLNFVEDAQNNQILLQLGLTPPKGVLLINDALDYTEEELYKLLLPKIVEIKGWIKGLADWAEFSTLSDILKDSKFEKRSDISIKI